MKILILCHGNICRSPMAEGILKHKVIKAGLSSVYIESAGFEPYHNGDSPDKRAIETMKKHNIDISNKKARLFKTEDFDNFDQIYFMDENNSNFVKSFARNSLDLAKTDFIMNVLNKKENNSVPDPYYGGNEGFEMVYKMLDTACDKIIETIQ